MMGAKTSRIVATKSSDAVDDGGEYSSSDEDQDMATFLQASAKLSSNKTTSSPPLNYITQLILEMENSLVALEAKDLAIPKLEKMAVFIYESMCISARNYHSVQHVFDIIAHDRRLGDNPIAVLAACFHDCIYYHVDGGLTSVQAKLLKGSYKVEGLNLEVQDNLSDYITKHSIYKFFASEERSANTENRVLLLNMVESIFGYIPGQNISITNDGLNEFLSALVAVRMLSDHLPLEILAQIACCIESTIPFRKIDEKTGKTHMQRLYDNMKETRDFFNLKLSDEDLVVSVQRSCLLSNSDVGNFSTTDRHWFLDNTWSLLPETNESLRNEYVYSVEHFHTALYKMYKFFGFLQPEVVFHEFQGVPDLPEMACMTQECSNNLEFGRTYVGAKLVAVSLLSAVAVLTDGDAPISLFTGDLRAAKRRGSGLVTKDPSMMQRAQMMQRQTSGLPFSKVRVSDFLRQPLHCCEDPPEESLKQCNEMVFQILAEGRRSESSFDTKRSPWAAMLYGYMGDEGLNQILTEHTLYPMTQEHAWNLLRALPPIPVHSIVGIICSHALSRQDKILDVLSKLAEENGDKCTKA